MPIEPNITRIVGGALWACLGVWLLTSWLPAHRPMDVLEQSRYLAEGALQFEDRTSHRMLTPSFFPIANVIAVLMIASGAGALLSGALFRRYKAVVCKRCRTMVLARKSLGGLRCPNGGHPAVASHVAWLSIVLLCLLFLIALGALAGYAVR